MSKTTKISLICLILVLLLQGIALLDFAFRKEKEIPGKDESPFSRNESPGRL
ncbi:hypothetical protein QET40_02035 [Akkermansia sp. N21169]|uniref:hypothetical protein n=1 Tax=Akkermansia sp. N21169 TaxID=3040765 RepID=UPI00244E7D34|nr:hypothetical protein [Akkermansia sp. N21169]MDH3067882.1 hypothetical protein [Akkermansia sp. N21169]